MTLTPAISANNDLYYFIIKRWGSVLVGYISNYHELQFLVSWKMMEVVMKLQMKVTKIAIQQLVVRVWVEMAIQQMLLEVWM